MDYIKQQLDLELTNSISNNISIKTQINNNIIYTQIRLKRLQHIIWHLLHSFSVVYPEVPSDELKYNTKQFITTLKYTLPFCKTCSSNTKDIFIQNYDINLAISNRNELIMFFIKYHTYINENFTNNINYNSSIFTLDYVINKYSDGKILEYLYDKYKINLFDIVSKKEVLDSLGIIMNSLQTKIHEEINNTQYDLIFSINIK